MNKAKAVNLFGCAPQHLGMETCPTHEVIQSLAAASSPVADLFAHRWPGVGRMPGCRPNISCAGDRCGT
jgi:hypothetical protein